MRFPVVSFAELDSTNSEAARRAKAGERGPMWITADRQTSGRGRQGRVWQGGQGNLSATLLLRTERPPAESAQLAFVAALAAADLVCAFVDPALVTLKWPNDVLIGGAKVCGVLTETGAASGGGLWLAIGFGTNLASAPSDTPYPATHLAAHGQGASSQRALETLDAAFFDWFSIWTDQGFGPIRAAWTKRAHGLGRPVRILVGSEAIEGILEGLDADGALLLRSAQGTVRRITAGDVIFGGA